jgi:hypothetical protein
MPRWSLRWLLLVLGLLLASLVPRAALAASRVVLVLAERGSPTESLEAQLLGALRGQLRELDVEVIVVQAAQEPLAVAAHRAKQIAAREHALGVTWLELPPGRISVFLYDASGHLYSREVEPEGSLASHSEAIAIILRSAIAAMVEGEAVGMNEIELPPPSPPPPAPAPPARHERGSDVRYVRAGPSYVGTLFAKNAGWQHGAGLALSIRPTRAPWFFGVDYTQFAATELAGGGTRIRLQRHPGEVFAGLELSVSALTFNVLGAVSADYVRRTTTQVSEGWTATPASGRWLWAASTRLGLTLPVSRRVFAVLTVGADFLLNPFTHVIAPTPASSELMGSPLRARPRAELGLTISAW